MKKYFFIILLGLIFSASCLVYVPYPTEEGFLPEEEFPGEGYEEPSPGLDVSYFYDYLSPYGIWIYYRPYGYVWIPQDMPYGWRPYTRGHWVWTDHGWTWRSQVIWGWAPFHYGRWGWDRDIGWFWTPGTIWGPGWVTWRSSDLYMGWAPLPPGTRFVAGIGIRRLAFRIPSSHWVFVEGPYFLSPSLHLHVFPYERNITIINYTVHKTNIYVRNNRVVNEGVSLDRVRRITKQNILKHELKDTNKAELRRIGAGKLEVYRPKIRKSQTAKPKAVLRKQEAKERMSKARILKLEKGVLPLAREKRIREVHEREVKLLERSQQKEMKELERKLEERKKAVRTQTEKKKVERAYKEEVIKLQKSHEAEKSEIKKRHKEEEEKAKKKEPKKKKIKKKVKK